MSGAVGRGNNCNMQDILAYCNKFLPITPWYFYKLNKNNILYNWHGCCLTCFQEDRGTQPLEAAAFYKEKTTGRKAVIIQMAGNTRRGMGLFPASGVSIPFPGNVGCFFPISLTQTQILILHYWLIRSMRNNLISKRRYGNAKNSRIAHWLSSLVS